MYLFYLAEALRSLGCDPVCVGEGDDERRGERFDAVISHYWTVVPTAFRLAERDEAPWVHTCHSLAPTWMNRACDPISRRRLAQERFAVRRADVICAGSACEAGEIEKRYGRVAQLVVNSPGVDVGLFRPGARGARPLGPGAVVLWVGRIARGKRLVLAVEAFARMSRMGDPSARLLVLGGPDGGEGKSELALARRRAAELRVGGLVEFVGPVPHRELPSYYAGADALLFTSERESFGLVVLEAQACGLPVVATAVGGVREVVGDGASGRIVAEASADTLGNALAGLLQERTARAVDAEASAPGPRFSWIETARRLLDTIGARCG